jgi:hypothetical protein
VTWLLSLLLAVAVTPPPEIRKAFEEGETLVYNLSWMRMTGGIGRMTISPADGERYRITSLAYSTPGFSRIFRFRDEIETTVARDDFSTLRYVKRLDEKGDTIEEVTTIENGVATRTRKKVKKVEVPRPVLDPISVMYYMRMVDLTPGKRYALTLIADGKVYTVDAKVLRREAIETPAGRFSTVVVEPQMTSATGPREEKLQVWYTDDARRIPVRIRSDIKIGAITANLTAIENGASAAQSPVRPR